MSTSAKLILGGDVSAEMVGHIAYLLQTQEISVDLETGDLESTASLIPTPDMLATVAAIAGVLSFLLSVRNSWRESRKTPTAQQDKTDELSPSLRSHLLSFKAEGFDVVRIEERSGSVVISLADIPGKQTIEIETRGKSSVEVRRRAKAE